MKKINVLLGVALMTGSGLAAAGSLAVGSASGASGTNVGPVAINFTGEGQTVGFQNDITDTQIEHFAMLQANST